MSSRISIFLVVALLLLAGCASNVPAPVVERNAPAREEPRPATIVTTPEVQPGFYTVKKGDTLYAIALDHGQDYKDIAAWNYLDNPNLIKVGQQLRVTPPDGAAPVVETRPIIAPPVVETRPINTSPNSDTLKHEPRGGTYPYSDKLWAQMQQAEAPPPAPAAPAAPPPAPAEKPAEAPPAPPAEKPAPPPVVNDEGIQWAWPTAGKLTATYSEGGNKGVDIAARTGQPVLAAAAGKVTLVSSALRGYGNLVVVKHNATYLSVYAHNSKILVTEGQAVTKGQQIAEVGNSDAEQPGLHFEIRRQGKPVDPTQYLPKR